MFSKIIITLVATRHGHYRPCAVAGQDIIPNPNGNAFLRQWMQCIGPRKHPTNAFHISHAVTLGSLLGLLYVGIHGRTLLIGSNLLNQF